MILSEETINILKNFGNINQGIYMKEGSLLKTVSPQMNILAQAKITEHIPVDFGIYDLNNFLSVLSLHKETPIFEFDKRHVIIIGNNGRSKIKYRFCEPSMIIVPPDKHIAVPNPEISVDINIEDFKWILKTASVLASPQISIRSDGVDVSIVTFDMNNNSAHTESLILGEGNGVHYDMIFRTESLYKIMMGSYHVDITSKGISYFKSVTTDLEYWVALESDSFYGV